MDRTIVILVYALEVIFAVGLLGSAVVWILTTVEDIKTLLLNRESKEIGENERHEGSRELTSGYSSANSEA